MEKRVVGIVMVLAGILLGGCATPLNSVQKHELEVYQVKGLAVDEKDPGAGAALGILPGGGSFYTRNYGLGVVNLLLWPLSILWDPVSGYEGALSINYVVTKTTVDTKRDGELSDLDDQLTLGTISKEDYVRRKREIESHYSAN
ncbi:MAG: hypothetical protein ACRETM_05135 [Stenotrophobium sp.]